MAGILRRLVSGWYSLLYVLSCKCSAPATNGIETHQSRKDQETMRAQPNSSTHDADQPRKTRSRNKKSTKHANDECSDDHVGRQKKRRENNRRPTYEFTFMGRPYVATWIGFPCCRNSQITESAHQHEGDRSGNEEHDVFRKSQAECFNDDGKNGKSFKCKTESPRSAIMEPYTKQLREPEAETSSSDNEHKKSVLLARRKIRLIWEEAQRSRSCSTLNNDNENMDRKEHIPLRSLKNSHEIGVGKTLRPTDSLTTRKESTEKHTNNETGIRSGIHFTSEGSARDNSTTENVGTSSDAEAKTSKRKSKAKDIKKLNHEKPTSCAEIQSDAEGKEKDCQTNKDNKVKTKRKSKEKTYPAPDAEGKEKDCQTNKHNKVKTKRKSKEKKDPTPDAEGKEKDCQTNTHNKVKTFKKKSKEKTNPAATSIESEAFNSITIPEPSPIYKSEDESQAEQNVGTSRGGCREKDVNERKKKKKPSHREAKNNSGTQNEKNKQKNDSKQEKTTLADGKEEGTKMVSTREQEPQEETQSNISTMKHKRSKKKKCKTNAVEEEGRFTSVTREDTLGSTRENILLESSNPTTTKYSNNLSAVDTTTCREKKRKEKTRSRKISNITAEPKGDDENNTSENTEKKKTPSIKSKLLKTTKVGIVENPANQNKDQPEVNIIVGISHLSNITVQKNDRQCSSGVKTTDFDDSKNSEFQASSDAGGNFSNFNIAKGKKVKFAVDTKQSEKKGKLKPKRCRKNISDETAEPEKGLKPTQLQHSTENTCEALNLSPCQPHDTQGHECSLKLQGEDETAVKSGKPGKHGKKSRKKKVAPV